VTSTIGVIQALISVFLDDNDKLRCINAGGTRITFLLRPPLYYACASSWGEPEAVVRTGCRILPARLLCALAKQDTLTLGISPSSNSEHRHGFTITTDLRTANEL
jgi:hypothetical protein